ncbi:DUF2339 domain-containing protein, partial [Loktanella sp. DJP18]|uniref:DUF2339 domain-containing protein n=1 Tax=Loktanella sp. DJP18 TaxID=3409788 RepID=UPI003BB4D6C4
KVRIEILEARSQTRDPAQIQTTADHKDARSVSSDSPVANRNVARPGDVVTSSLQRPPKLPAQEQSARAMGRKASEPRTPDFIPVVASWISQNWIYVISALCLSLAGIFAAQFAAEQGFLAPIVRIGLAIILGFVFIVGGDFIRRRFGDQDGVVTEYLPSVFSGAGIVTLFGAVLTAQALYGMISPAVSMALLVCVAALSVVLGWFYGPVLAVVGIVGATAAPFLAGGEAGSPALMSAYFCLISLAGLVINTLRKWRWIDAVSLILPYAAAGFVMSMGEGASVPFIIHATAVAIMALVFLGGSLQMRMASPSLLLGLAFGSSEKVDHRQVVAAGIWAAVVTGIVMWGGESDVITIVAIGACTLLFGISLKGRVPHAGAVDLAVMSAVGLFAIGIVWVCGMEPRSIYLAAIPQISSLYVLVAAGLVTSALAAYRSISGSGFSAYLYAGLAALIGPGLMISQEMLGSPAAFTGVLIWSGISLLFAAGATLFAERALRRDPDNRLLISMGVLIAFTMIALALFVVFTKTALTIALSVLILGSAGLGDRFRLPALRYFVQIGAAVISYRAVVQPGFLWAISGSTIDLLLAYAVPFVLVAAALLLVGKDGRVTVRAALEGLLVVLGGVGMTAAIYLYAGHFAAIHDDSNHLTIGLVATVWLIAGTVSLMNAFLMNGGSSRAHRAARMLRLVSASVAFLLAGAGLIVNITIANPLFRHMAPIFGSVGLSSLTLGYLLPGLVLLGMSLRLRVFPRAVRVIAASAGGVLAFLYAFLTIAQAWRGDVLTIKVMSEGELWSHSGLLIAVGAGLLILSLRKQSKALRIVANGVLVFAIAKVFLIDASDLAGLMRAGSFLVLGLALAGLALVNRTMGASGQSFDSRQSQEPPHGAL